MRLRLLPEPPAPVPREPAAVRFLQIQQSLYLSVSPSLTARAEGGSRPVKTYATGSAYAVNKVLGDLRQIVIDHIRNPFDVNSAGSDVGRSRSTIAAFLESAQCQITFKMRTVSVNTGGFGSAANQLLRPTIRPMLRAGENQKRTPFILEHLFEQAEFAIMFDLSGKNASRHARMVWSWTQSRSSPGL